jgi:hypothetical protein
MAYDARLPDYHQSGDMMGMLGVEWRGRHTHFSLVTDVEIRCFGSGEKIMRSHVRTVNQKFGAPNYTGTHQIAPIPPVHAVSAFQH